MTPSEAFRRGVVTRRSPRLPAETRHARADRPVPPSKAAEYPGHVSVAHLAEDWDLRCYIGEIGIELNDVLDAKRATSAVSAALRRWAQQGHFCLDRHTSLSTIRSVRIRP